MDTLTFIQQSVQNGTLSISEALKMLQQENIKEEHVNHPGWYNEHPSGVECIDIARHYCFSIGNAIKYLWRAGLKKDSSMSDKQKEIEDLKKAVWYIQDRIKELENETMDQK